MNVGLNSFQRWALVEIQKAGFEARPHANWVAVRDGHCATQVYTVQGVKAYIADNVSRDRAF